MRPGPAQAQPDISRRPSRHEESRGPGNDPADPLSSASCAIPRIWLWHRKLLLMRDGCGLTLPQIGGPLDEASPPDHLRAPS